MGFPIRLGVSLVSSGDGPRLAADFESRGFDLVLVADHLFNYRRPEEPFIDAWMRLAAITQTTDRVRLGTLVTNLSWRQPVTVAKNAIAVDQLSGGRLELGVGCGAYGDQAMAGMADMAAGERIRRLEEGLQVLDRLLRGDTRPFAGQFTSYDHAEVAPGCIQSPRPPLVVAAAGTRALTVAARWADTWNCVTGEGDIESSVSMLSDRIRRLDASCERRGRDPATLRRSLLVWPAARLEAGEPGGINPWAHDSALLEIVERFSSLGFSDFVVFSPTPESSDVLDYITTEVLPMLRAERVTPAPR